MRHSSPVNLIVMLLLFTLIIGIGIYVQKQLSKSDNKYLGLILPIISFLLSLSMILGMSSFYAMSTDTMGMGQMMTTKNPGYLGILPTFLIANISTLILLGIYGSERDKIKTNKSIEKMKIRDL